MNVKICATKLKMLYIIPPQVHQILNCLVPAAVLPSRSVRFSLQVKLDKDLDIYRPISINEYIKIQLWLFEVKMRLRAYFLLPVHHEHQCL